MKQPGVADPWKRQSRLLRVCFLRFWGGGLSRLRNGRRRIEPIEKLAGLLDVGGDLPE